MAARLTEPVRAAARLVGETVRGSGLLWTATLVVDRLLPLGVLGLWPDTRVSAAVLVTQLTAILRAWGMSAEHAAITVEHLLYADLRGIDSHGSSMMLHYHRARAAGSLAMSPAIALVREGATTALLDGGGGLGHVPADLAMKIAIAKCREAGMGAVAVRNSGHFGAAGAYVSMAAREGLIGLATTNTERPALVPAGGVEAGLGTNPIALAAPGGRGRPFLLDMATSSASLGRMATAWRKGRSIPAGWALDAAGRPVTSGRAAVEHRRLTPLGGTPEMSSHKGYGLAVAVEILSAVLSGARGPRTRGAVAGVGHFFLAIDPARFRDDGGFGGDLDALLESLRASRPLDPARPVLVAGDPEEAVREERGGAGIPLPRGVLEDLRAVARAAGVPFTLDARG